MAKKKKKNRLSDEDDDDDTFYYRYASAPSSSADPPNLPTSSAAARPAGTLAPSKSTLYVSNLDYSLTNSDLHTLFSTAGKIARVTVLKDRRTRLSRGVAFVQFVSRDDALSAAARFHGKVLNGRTLTASIASDNGRAPEFIRKRVYKDKSRCYECGAEGHLSYECPRNRLGPRERPPERKPRRERRGNWGKENEAADEAMGSDEGGGGERFEEDNWASVVDGGADDRLLEGGGGDGGASEKKRARKASYFSDESGDEDD